MVATRLNVWRCLAPPVGPALDKWQRSWVSAPSTAPLLWTRCSVWARRWHQDPGAVSAPSSATGPLLGTFANPVLKQNQSWLHSSCTNSTVPRAGCTQKQHQCVSRVLIKENPGVWLPDSVRLVEAALLSHHLLPAYKLCWSPSTWWLQQASIGLGPRWICLVLGAGIGCRTTTGLMGILCQ